MIEGFGVDNMTTMIVDNLMSIGGLLKSNIAKKLVCFGVHGVIVFQGTKIGVTEQLQEKHVPFLIGVHCVVH